MQIVKKIALTGLAGLALAAVVPGAVAQLGNAISVEKFAVHNNDSISVVSYSVVDTILETFVIEQKGRSSVRYSVMKGQGQRAIESIVSGFENIKIEKLSRDQQLAYWLNLRTLMVLHSTSAAYPSANPELLLKPNSGFLNTPLITVSGEDLSINDVDNILLTHWKDEPNLVFGLLVPTKNSPDFPRKAFDGQTVRSTLEAMGRSYINRKDVVKASKSKTSVSQFLLSHKEHFGGEQALVAHAKSLAAPKLASKWSDTARLQSKASWKLNELQERSLASSGRRGGFGGGFGGGGFSGGGGGGGFGGGS